MYNFLLELSVILFAAKSFGLIFRKIGAPQVVGEIFAGLLLGPSCMGIFQGSDTLSLFAEIGVILLMFSTGLGTNLHELKKTGLTAFLIAAAGVLLPLITGSLLYGIFFGFAAIGSSGFYSALFVGTIMTATSVSITVAVLSELGKLNTTTGTTIVNAAIIDDVLGIITLTCVSGAGSGEGGSVTMVFIKTVLFFLLAIVGGFLVNQLMAFLDKRYNHTQRIPIFALCYCFLMAYLAETYFGIADITGAYLAGVALCNIDDASYIGRKVDISAYMLFGPLFFAGIGIKTDLHQLTPQIITFAICFVLVALISKVISCGSVALLRGSGKHEALKVGIGMMTRGEVALIVTQKGIDAGLISNTYFTPVILLILCSSFISPVVLKMLYKKDPAPAEQA